MTRKEFTIKEASGLEVKLTIRQPQYSDLEQAEQIAGAKLAWLVKQLPGKRPLLREQLDEFLRKENIWTVEDERTVETLQSKIDDDLNKLRKGGIKLSDGREIAISIMDKRKEIVQKMSKRQLFDESTIQAIAENERTDYLVYICTVDASTGDCYWESFEDMKNDKLSETYSKAVALAYEVIYNVNPSFEKNLPENKWLKKYNFIDEELNYTDRKTGNKVDRLGEPVKKLEDAIQKRVDNLQGEIKEEVPFIDDETGKPVPTEQKSQEIVVDKKEELKPIEVKKEELKEVAIVA